MESLETQKDKEIEALKQQTLIALEMMAKSANTVKHVQEELVKLRERVEKGEFEVPWAKWNREFLEQKTPRSKPLE